MNADPAIAERCRAGMAAFLERPGVREELAKRIKRVVANLTSEQIEARRAKGRHIAATVLHRPDVAARSNSTEAKAKAGRARTATVLAWCPEEYRDHYRYLKATKQLSAAEARHAIEGEIAAEQRRRQFAQDEAARRKRSSGSSLEAQMSALAAGARLVTVHPMRKADPDFTLGGIATGLL